MTSEGQPHVGDEPVEATSDAGEHAPHGAGDPFSRPAAPRPPSTSRGTASVPGIRSTPVTPWPAAPGNPPGGSAPVGGTAGSTGAPADRPPSGRAIPQAYAAPAPYPPSASPSPFAVPAVPPMVPVALERHAAPAVPPPTADHRDGEPSREDVRPFQRGTAPVFDRDAAAGSAPATSGLAPTGSAAPGFAAPAVESADAGVPRWRGTAAPELQGLPDAAHPGLPPDAWAPPARPAGDHAGTGRRDNGPEPDNGSGPPAAFRPAAAGLFATPPDRRGLAEPSDQPAGSGAAPDSPWSPQPAAPPLPSAPRGSAAVGRAFPPGDPAGPPFPPSGGSTPAPYGAAPGSTGPSPAGEPAEAPESPFRGQRVRVPGATLTDLPDAPIPMDRAGRSRSGGFPAHSGDDRSAGSASLSAQVSGDRPADGGFPDSADEPLGRGLAIPQSGAPGGDVAAVPLPRTPPGSPAVSSQGAPVSGAGDQAGRPVTASASVPVSSRVQPPVEHSAPVTGPPSAPQPRVYGRPAQDDAPPAVQPPPVRPEPPAGGRAAVASARVGVPGINGSPAVTPAPAGPGFEPPDPDGPWTGLRDAQSDSGRFTGSPSNQEVAPGRDADHRPFAGPDTDHRPFGGSEADHRRFASPEADHRPFTSREADNRPFAGREADHRPFGGPAVGPHPGERPERSPFEPPAGRPDPMPFRGGESERTTFGLATGPVSPPKAGQFGSPESGAFGAPEPGPFGSPEGGPGRSAPAGGGYAPGVAPAGFRPVVPPYSERTDNLANRLSSGAPPALGAAPAVPAPALSPYIAPGVPAERANPAARGFGTVPAEQDRTAVVGQVDAAPVTEPGPWPGQPGDDEDQTRFEAFKPEQQPAAEPEPAPNIRSGRVLLAVLAVAVLVLGLPLFIVWLLVASRSDDSAFDVQPGSCVRQDGDRAVTADCGAEGAFNVVSRVDSKERCTDLTQPYIVVPAGNGKTEVLCLKPAGP